MLKPEFRKDKKAAVQLFNTFEGEKEKYFNTNLAFTLNSLGYEMLYEHKDINKAIELFEFATKEFPENANLYDSLGEAYFTNEDYEKAFINYNKSLELNPDNDNAKKYIAEINQLKSGQ